MALPTSRTAIFAALAQGLDFHRVRKRFQLSREELQEIFQEVADYYQDLEEGRWTLYCDGASRGNPGPAGAGAVLIDPRGAVREQLSEYLGQTTNNVAEYQALIRGLAMARKLGVRSIQVWCDAELLVRQLNGRYRVKSPRLLPLWQEAARELQSFAASAISHVPRELNDQADRLANQAIDREARAR